MNTTNSLALESPQVRYARSLSNPAKRKFAHDYTDWLANGKVGIVPDRGQLSVESARLMVITIESVG